MCSGTVRLAVARPSKNSTAPVCQGQRIAQRRVGTACVRPRKRSRSRATLQQSQRNSPARCMQVDRVATSIHLGEVQTVTGSASYYKSSDVCPPRRVDPPHDPRLAISHTMAYLLQCIVANMAHRSLSCTADATPLNIKEPRTRSSRLPRGAAESTPAASHSPFLAFSATSSASADASSTDKPTPVPSTPSTSKREDSVGTSYPAKLPMSLTPMKPSTT